MLKESKIDETLAAYQHAINAIDDYFEYDGFMHKKTFKQSQKHVHDILDALTSKLREINK